MEKEISKEDIQGILKYMETLKGYDKLSQLHMNAVTFILWAFIFFAGGILDITFEYYEVEWGSIISWMVLSFFGGFFHRLLSTRELAATMNSTGPTKARNMSHVILILLVFSWAFTFYLGFTGNGRYILVSVPLTIGLLFLYFIIRSVRSQVDGIKNIELLKLFPQFLKKMPPMTGAFLAAIFNLILLSFFAAEFSLFSGLSMGLIVGSGFLIDGVAKYREFMGKLETRRI